MNAERREFSLPLARPLETAAGRIDERAGTALLVRDGDAVGVGEATPLPGWTEPIERCRDRLDAAARALDRGDVTGALDAVEDAPAARHAVSLALSDLCARRNGEPLYRHLGAVGRVERVPANATIGDGTPQEAAAAAREAVDEGFTCLKVKVGARSLAEDAVRIETVRDEIGWAASLRADANAAWSERKASEALTEFALQDVAYVEQPLAADDLAGHAALRRDSVGVGVALDETLASTPVEDVIEAGAADVIVLKPMALGGIDRARRAALRARRRGVTPVVTTTIDGAVARTAAVHLAASIPGIPACGLATADRLAEDLAPDPAPIEDGDVAVPQDAGLGTLGPWEDRAGTEGEGGPR